MLSDMETREEEYDEIPVCIITKEVSEEPTVVTAERPMVITELKEAPVGDGAREVELVMGK